VLCKDENWLEELCEELSNVLRMYKVLRNVSKQHCTVIGLWEYAGQKKKVGSRVKKNKDIESMVD